jgi:hypothetical protein
MDVQQLTTVNGVLLGKALPPPLRGFTSRDRRGLSLTIDCCRRRQGLPDVFARLLG